MLASTLIDEVYRAYRGKGASRTPAWGTEKANTALSIANRKQREWATDPNNRWASLFEVRDVSPVIATNTPTYDLDDDFMFPSDYAMVTRTSGSLSQYPIITPQRRNLYEQGLYISGRSPKQVTFSQTIDTGLSGGTLAIPGYYMPADMVNASDTVAVDSPEWLIYITASELARNDAAKDDQYVNLVNQANDLYRKMIDNNNGGAFLQPFNIANNMPQINDGLDYDWLD